MTLQLAVFLYFSASQIRNIQYAANIIHVISKLCVAKYISHSDLIFKRYRPYAV